jgi:hypothetical protein
MLLRFNTAYSEVLKKVTASSIEGIAPALKMEKEEEEAK